MNDENTNERVPSFPDLVFLELLCIMGVLLFFIVVSLYLNAPLEEIANPSDTPNPAKAPWYFVGFQELLVYFDPWVGGVAIPVFIILGLMVIPFLSRGRREGQYEGPTYQRLSVSIFTFGIALWCAFMIIGQFFRGPSWNWYWPWESWTLHKEVPAHLRSFPVPLGVAFLAGFFLLFLIAPALKWRHFYKRLGLMRYLLFTIFLALFSGVVIKILLRLIFGVKYILQTPLFNI